MLNKSSINLKGGILDTSYRDSLRVMIDDFGTAEFMFKALRPLIPLTCGGALAKGINERLRFLKYNPGGNFKPHIDGCFPRNKYEESMVTLQIYLNEVKEGGATRFFHHDSSIFKNVNALIRNSRAIDNQLFLYHTRINGMLNQQSAKLLFSDKSKLQIGIFFILKLGFSL